MAAISSGTMTAFGSESKNFNNTQAYIDFKYLYFGMVVCKLKVYKSDIFFFTILNH